MKIGAQLYTVRDFCKTTDDLLVSLKKVADIGYKYVQLSGICDCDPKWLKSQLDNLGLIGYITHNNADRLVDITDKVIDAHKDLNCHYIGLGWYDFRNNNLSDFIEKYAKVADKIKDAGYQFMYHNHDFEFKKQDGKIILMHLADKFTPEQMCFTLDTFWAQAGGCDPAKLICELKGRVPCVHYKDMSYDRRMEAVGQGNMNWDSIINASEKSGVEVAFVEQDDCNGDDPFMCLKQSYDFLIAQGLKA